MYKLQIVSKNWQFQEIIDSKQQIVTKNLILYYKKFTNFEIGISIPKKFANSVKRNFYKRQIKNVLRKLIKNYDLPNFRIILITRKSFLDLKFVQKEEKIQKIFEELLKNVKQAS
ncbi:Ribonuclease P protein component [Mesomycoplasma conjunctivae]|uniref:Ribonuclease P protein component n=1 Tax=Mesomycoplasma conjunctivae (strain ATCC 25834 / NCTC 10147 / HRC/581) TaxID=572263 RepID=C5J7F2_MESCH|nr:Ribonuclease P protein component [Mesomycoplasma conjunctivae]